MDSEDIVRTQPLLRSVTEQRLVQTDIEDLILRVIVVVIFRVL
jgi:hypothetical protein